MGVSLLDRLSSLYAKVLPLNSDAAKGALLVNPPIKAGDAGFVAIASEADDGSFTGTRIVRALDSSKDYRLRVGEDSLLFNHKFPGSALNTAHWNQILSTMTLVVGGGFVTLNSGLSTASGAYAALKSYKQFPCYGTFGVWAQAQVQFASLPIANNVCEVGAFIAATNAAPTDGVFLRYTAGGAAQLVVNFAGAETSSAAFDPTSLLPANTTHKLLIGIMDNSAELWIDDVRISVVPLPASQGDITASAELPFMARTYNSAATSVAQVIKIGMVNITLADANPSKLWSEVMGGNGDMGDQTPDGSTVAINALWSQASATAPSPGVPTAAAAVLGVGLGGRFYETMTKAINTDVILDSFLVPAGSNAVPGKSLYIKGVWIDSFVQTILAGGPFIEELFLAFGHTAIGLSTAEGAGTKKPRIRPIGIQNFAVTAAVGVVAQRVWVSFDVPVLVQPGEYVQVVECERGVVGTSGVVGHVIGFDAYWE